MTTHPPTFQPCHCPEAALLRQLLAGAVPAADTPMWRALTVLVDAAAAYRIRHATDDPPTRAITRAGFGPPFTELERRRAEHGCPVRCPHCGRARTTWPPPATTAALACPRCRPHYTPPAPWPQPAHRAEAA